MSKECKFVNEPVIEMTDSGEKIPFIAESIKNNRHAYAASLNIIFKHIADFHITILEIVAEKHGLKVDEILEEVYNDVRYKNMPRLFNTLGYFNEEEKEEEKEEKKEEKKEENKEVKKKRVKKNEKLEIKEEEVIEEIEKLEIKKEEKPKVKRVTKRKE